MTGAIVKGWCPSAYRPMMSGDGLLVRVRPRLGRLTADEAHMLADLSKQFGNGMIDMTSRGNLQIRGVKEAGHLALVDALKSKGLVHPDPEIEARRAIVAAPDWQPGDATERLGTALEAALPEMPATPDKVGFVIDIGPKPRLRNVSGDFRFETDASGELLLSADGAQGGRIITEDTAIPALLKLVAWFAATGGGESKRMHRHIRTHPLPEAWQATPRQSDDTAEPLGYPDTTYGVPFGALKADDLQTLLSDAGPSHIRVTPWKTLILENARPVHLPGFLAKPDTVVMTAHACPGAPHCNSASVATRALALKLADQVPGRLHVSGCEKGCAHPKPAEVVLVGRNGRFDLVRQGRAGDTPEKTGLTRADLLELFS